MCKLVIQCRSIVTVYDAVVLDRCFTVVPRSGRRYDLRSEGRVLVVRKLTLCDIVTAVEFFLCLLGTFLIL